MDLSGCNIGFAITGSFCTFDKIKLQIKKLVDAGAIVTPVFSFNSCNYDNRFTKAKDFTDAVCEITGNQGIRTIQEAEPIGPKAYLDVMVAAPCTGNTLAKLANGIVDTPVLMAIKAHLRNNKPVVIAVSTNDALGINFANIGKLMNYKNIYFVPFGQDDYVKKPNSLVADMDSIDKTIMLALEGKQIEPVIY
jgi:dipicolinate synthase subunit B